MKETLPEDFYRPPPDLTLQLLRASQGISQEDESTPPPPIILEAREDISLRLWGCLAGLARASTIAQGRDSFVLSIEDAFPQLCRSMQRRLAIPSSEFNRGLIEYFMWDGFFTWLRIESNGFYPAPWGIMKFDGESLAFSEVHLPRFLNGDYRKAHSLRKGKGRTQDRYASR